MVKLGREREGYDRLYVFFCNKCYMFLTNIMCKVLVGLIITWSIMSNRSTSKCAQINYGWSIDNEKFITHY